MNRADIDRWRPFMENLRDRTTMLLLVGSFPEVVAAMVGFDVRDDGRVLGAFREWLVERSPPEMRSHFFSSLVVAQAVPIRAGSPGIGLPPRDEVAALAKLYELFDEFLDDVASRLTAAG